MIKDLQRWYFGRAMQILVKHAPVMMPTGADFVFYLLFFVKLNDQDLIIMMKFQICLSYPDP